MYALSRIDYTRLQELRYAVYGLLIAMLLLVLAVATATRGAKAWIDLPLFGASSRPSSARCCSSSRWRASW